MGLKLELTDVILGPVVSDKAAKLNQDQNELVLRVHKSANKPIIARAIEILFNTKVDSVRTYIRKGKNRKVGRAAVRSKNEKRAIIKLKEGYRVDLLEQMPTQAPAGQEKPE